MAKTCKNHASPILYPDDCFVCPACAEIRKIRQERDDAVERASDLQQQKEALLRETTSR